MAWIGSLQDLITGFGFLAFMVACFFPLSFLPGMLLFIHAWALPAILLYEIHRNERNNDNPLKFSDEIVVSN